LVPGDLMSARGPASVAEAVVQRLLFGAFTELLAYQERRREDRRAARR
jgi:hypothetical protein